MRRAGRRFKSVSHCPKCGSAAIVRWYESFLDMMTVRCDSCGWKTEELPLDAEET